MGPGAEAGTTATSGPQTKISKTTPCKGTRARRAALLPHFRPRRRQKSPTLISSHAKTPRDAMRPGFCWNRRTLSNQRAQGMPGAQCARRRMCSGGSRKKAHALVRSHRNHPAFPTQCFTAYGVLASAVAFSTVAGRSLPRLEASIGCIGTTRFCRPPRAPQSKALSTATATRPALLTFAQRPSEWDGMKRDIAVIWGFGKSEYFFKEGLTVNSPDLPVGQISGGIES
jgi:hypothetical protein